jgi:uncharacterized protein (UPF0276 family)
MTPTSTPELTGKLKLTGKPKLGLPNLGMGLGLRPQHFEYILEHQPKVDWFEVISENFMSDFGWCRHVLLRLRETYPIVMHGVSMSIGSTDPLNMNYLASLKQLAADVEPEWISDHLCWTGVNHVNTHDLLPVPLTRESLNHICQRVSQVQDYLQRPLVLENPSTYLSFKESTIEEWEFLNLLSRRTGCGLLLDVNNVYVSARNHGFDAADYIDQLDHDAIVQTHLSGHTDLGDHCVDTHDQPVCDAVWELYARLSELTGGVSTLLEWDANVPSFSELHAELKKADRVIKGQKVEQVAPQINSLNVSNPIDFMLGVR